MIFTMTIAWTVSVAFVWSSIPASNFFTKRLIAIAGLASVFAFLVVGLGIYGYVHAVNELFLPLPGSEAVEQPLDSSKELLVHIVANDAVVIAGQQLTIASLPHALERHYGSGLYSVVTLDLEPDVSIDVASQVLNVCASLGITSVSFRADEEE